MPDEAPYHEGELRVQQRAGEAEIGRRTAGVIADSILPGALEIIAQQTMAVLGSVDSQQDVWASLLVSLPGVINADDSAVEIYQTQSVRQPHDPLWAAELAFPEPRVEVLQEKGKAICPPKPTRP